MGQTKQLRRKIIITAKDQVPKVKKTVVRKTFTTMVETEHHFQYEDGEEEKKVRSSNVVNENKNQKLNKK